VKEILKRDTEGSLSKSGVSRGGPGATFVTASVRWLVPDLELELIRSRCSQRLPREETDGQLMRRWRGIGV